MMKKLTLSLFALFTICSICLTAQSSSKWSVELHGTPEYYSGNSSFVDEYNISYNLLSDQFNYSIGTNVNYRFANRWELSTGLAYSNKDHTSHVVCPLCLTADASPHSSFISPYPEVAKLRYIEVPVGMRFHILDKKMGLFTEMGMTTGLRVSKIWHEGTLWNLGSYAGLGARYTFCNHFSLQLLAQYEVSTMTGQINKNGWLQSLGLRTGMAYHF